MARSIWTTNHFDCLRSSWAHSARSRGVGPSLHMSAPLDVLFLDSARGYLTGEYPAKLRVALAALPEERLWWRPNDGSNSVGNLLLHLNGNLRQWMVAGVGGETFERNRAAEFAAREGASAPGM